jgi:hypothetical protein
VDSCRLGNHKNYLFLEDVSYKYASSLENKVYYDCICLECGITKEFRMDRASRRRVIYTNTSREDTLLLLPQIKDKYIELRNKGLNGEEISNIINSSFINTNNSLKKIKK